ncbi:MAG: IS21 family transposase [Acidobacteria bacterium]|nr:IS21 family transposase [Acidobacteriota bacterium]
MVTDAQVRRLREKRMDGKTVETAAVTAGMSERTARRWQDGPLPSAATAPRTWRTRADPFAEVWASEVVPRLAADAQGRLQALTLFEWLGTRYPGRFQPGQLRTLQRRVRDWRALHGPDVEVYFEQVAVPGREGALDFTDAHDLGVTIHGAAFPHLLFEFVLSFSGWTYVALAASETFEALVAGLQGAVWTLGAIPAVIRHDNLSAATHELKRSGGRQLTTRFRSVLEHYGVRSSRIQPRKAHENGVVEQAHFRTKTAVEQALLLRGHADFVDEATYETFVRDVVERRRNAPAAARLAEERPYLRPLPASPVPNYTTFTCVVRRWSTIRVGGRTYSVPSRLIGHTVEARQHPTTVEVRYRGQVVETMPRLRGEAGQRIDYRHIISSLVRKPGAFARYRYREELFPSLTFRQAYDALGHTHGERADVEYVRLLHLAATTSERQVETTLRDMLQAGHAFDYARVQALVTPTLPSVPVIHLPPPDLAHYDALLEGGGRC